MTAVEMQQHLSAGSFTSVDLIQASLAQIDAHDSELQAVVSTSPNVLSVAKQLDSERAAGHVRGPLHGIPILLKDNIATDQDLGMRTTAGSFALAASWPKENAAIVKQLIDHGMIILAKSQMTEFMQMKTINCPPGWSAVKGQCLSAYVEGGLLKNEGPLGHSGPGGSSTGSAVGVSAGYAPLAIGTDSLGSLISPAVRAALYCLRPTLGLVSTSGTLKISDLFDTLGPMAKSAADIAHLLDAIVDPEAQLSKGKFSANLASSWKRLKVGFVDPTRYQYSSELQRPNAAATKQILEETQAAYALIKSQAKKFQEVDLGDVDAFTVNDKLSIPTLFEADFGQNVEHYLRATQDSHIQTLGDVIEFNDKHASRELPSECPDQELLLACLKNNITREERINLRDRVRLLGQDRGIDAALKSHDLDVIIAPADSMVHVWVTAAGYPSATLPLSYLSLNGRPFGLVVFTTAHREDLLIRTMSAWEKTFPQRKPPPKLVGLGEK